MNFEPVTLQDKDLMNRFFTQQRYENCECTFGNLYIWQPCFCTAKALVDDFLVIRGTEGKNYILPPFGTDETKIPAVLSQVAHYFAQHGEPFCMHGASPAFVTLLQSLCPDLYQYEPLRSSWDYVYDRNDLTTLAGRKYHGKRNHLSYFKKTYPDYEYRTLTEDLVPGCLQMAMEWCEKKGCNDDASLNCEKSAILRGLEQADYLNFKGGVILLAGKVVAFTFGEVLNEDTAVIHVEKSDPDIRGLYVAINQAFCQHEWLDKTYINREEDLGIAGLRKAKESYYPVHMNEKYKVTLK